MVCDKSPQLPNNFRINILIYEISKLGHAWVYKFHNKTVIEICILEAIKDY